MTRFERILAGLFAGSAGFIAGAALLEVFVPGASAGVVKLALGGGALFFAAIALGIAGGMVEDRPVTSKEQWRQAALAHERIRKTYDKGDKR